MEKKIGFPTINSIAIFLALFYAFSTRSVIGPLVFRGAILWLFYGAIYFFLLVSLITSFQQEGRHIYAPSYFFSVLLLFIVITSNLYHAGSMTSLLYYGIALLLPFSLRLRIKESKGISIGFVIIGIFLFVGCFINYVFPATYRATILPLYTESAQTSISWQAGFGTYFPGFTSQVGYTSFFLSIAFGALFCFRKTVFRGWFIPLAIILFTGLLLTGKRAPSIFLLSSVMILYFYERRGQGKVIRIIQIILIMIILYFFLLFIARVTNNPAITRIFDGIQGIIATRDFEDVGRSQLWNQAIDYFSDNMLFGIGWTNYKELFTLRRTHVHNIYLQLLCETGLVGFLIFVIFFVNNIRITLKKLKYAIPATLEYSWLMLSLFIQLFFLLYGTTGNPLYDVEETIIYFFGAGIGFLPMLTDVEGTNRGLL